MIKLVTPSIIAASMPATIAGMVRRRLRRSRIR
jgi:hypothetical protein